jgi:hypothetical protein
MGCGNHGCPLLGLRCRGCCFCVAISAAAHPPPPANTNPPHIRVTAHLSSLQPLPDLSTWVYNGTTDYQNKTADVWVNQYVKQDKTNTYRMLFDNATGAPLQLHILGYNIMGASHYDGVCADPLPAHLCTTVCGLQPTNANGLVVACLLQPSGWCISYTTAPGGLPASNCR